MPNSTNSPLCKEIQVSLDFGDDLKEVGAGGGGGGTALRKQKKKKKKKIKIIENIDIYH